MPYTNRRIKKSQAVDYYNNYRKYVPFVGLIFSAVILAIDYKVIPSLLVMYGNFEIPFPIFLEYFDFIIYLWLIVSSYLVYTFWFTPADYKALEMRLSEFDDEEFIHISKVTGINYEFILFTLLGLTVGGLVVNIIEPLYGITSR